MENKIKNFRIRTCEMHTCGEPVRIIECVEPPIQYPKESTILEKKQYLTENYDFIRTMVIFEPRGHSDMFGVIITDPDYGGSSDFGLIFLNNEGYASMCGHATIAIGRYLLEKGKVTPKIPETEIILDCPCGVVKVSVEWDGHNIGNTKFINVPAFVQCLDHEIYVPELERSVTCDIAFGGNFYGIVSDKYLGINFGVDSPSKIVDSATFLFNRLKETMDFHHPSNKKLGYLYGIIVTDGKDASKKVKTLCVFGIKSFDRSPCGSGTTALLACQYFRGNMKLKEKKITLNPFVNENCYFQGIPVEEVNINSSGKDLKAIRIEITGRSFFTGETLMTYEEDDYLKFGFIV